MTRAFISLKPGEFRRLSDWLKANAAVPGWLGGFNLGNSYIDDRVKGGATYEQRKAYVALDHETARMVPDARGMSAHAVRTLLAERAAEGE